MRYKPKLKRLVGWNMIRQQVTKNTSETAIENRDEIGKILCFTERIQETNMPKRFKGANNNEYRVKI